MAEGQAGWMEVLLADVVCVTCAPSREEACRRFGLSRGYEGVMPVGREWADRQPLSCDACGRRL